MSAWAHHLKGDLAPTELRDTARGLLHLDGEAATLIQRFAESSAPVVQLVRRAIAGGLDLPFDEAVSHAEDVYLNMLLATEDVEEGLKAVVEKRKPAWKDR